jgi:hypothetical protein
MGIFKYGKHVPGWVGGWLDVKAGLRIDYRNKKLRN